MSSDPGRRVRGGIERLMRTRRRTLLATAGVIAAIGGGAAIVLAGGTGVSTHVGFFKPDHELVVVLKGPADTLEHELH